jgi:uncharacterized protein
VTSAFVDGRHGTIIRVRVTPRSRREEILPDYEEEIRVKLTALPAEGRANEALVKLLARVLDIPRRDVEIVSGVTSRRKAVRVTSLTAAEVEERLGRFLSGGRRTERDR